MSAKIKEKDIQRAILDYLRLKGFLAWKQVNTGITTRAGKTSFFPMGMRGVSDIIAIKDEAVCLIEVKTPKGKLSEYQKEFLANARKHGAIAFVAKSIDDVVKVLEEYNLI